MDYSVRNVRVLSRRTLSAIRRGRSAPPELAEAIELLAEAVRAGGTIVKSPRPTSWGGYGGYFADPEGYLWEVATGATQLPFSE
jgi:catechol 2,3-dioxygenase-like lactoylglutathione lyase family enzyme